MFYDRVYDTIIESFKIFARVVLSPLNFPVIHFGQVIELNYEARIYNLEDVLVSDEALHKYWIDTYPSLRVVMSKLSSEDMKDFLRNSKKLFLSVLANMKRKLPFNAEIFSDCEPIFHPVPFRKANWKQLGERFTNIITQSKLERFNFELERFETNEEIIAKRLRNFTGTPVELWQRLLSEYTCMKDLALALLTLTHLSCPVERIFSCLKDFKTGKRNKLKVNMSKLVS